MLSCFDELLALADKLGLTIRHAHLGGTGGGLATFKNRRHLFIDLDAPAHDQLEQTARALAPLPELQSLYLRPDLRQLLDSVSPPVRPDD